MLHSSKQCYTAIHGHRQQGGRGPLWIFIHGKDIVDTDLIGYILVFFCYFSIFFTVAPPPWRRLNSAIFFPLPFLPLDNFLSTPLLIYTSKKRLSSRAHIEICAVTSFSSQPHIPCFSSSFLIKSQKAKFSQWNKKQLAIGTIKVIEFF